MGGADGDVEECEKVRCFIFWGPENRAENQKVAVRDERRRGGGHAGADERRQGGLKRGPEGEEGRGGRGSWAWPNVSEEVQRGGSETAVVQGFICIAVVQQHSGSVSITNTPPPNASLCRS